ncbi:hypothetical protein BJF95_14215 [Rhizobium oryziradicis]|uniref:Uncharacterized protein n=1 Tax=Rhizobium oryziradicis TaxID=1867956 RepID=A0A1Q8ZXU2_9HYPH|nr:hypothetical protein BJF95_14215 [Rhizobium oryziradicis]
MNIHKTIDIYKLYKIIPKWTFDQNRNIHLKTRQIYFTSNTFTRRNIKKLIGTPLVGKKWHIINTRLTHFFVQILIAQMKIRLKRTPH